ncbi:MAG: hypothetical protein R3C39_05020 [Dehalococcoidia bacterium]
MTVQQSRQLGQAIMGAAGLSLVLVVFGALRRSYFAIAIPVTIGVGIASGIAFWVGYTMSTAQWEDEDFADFEAAATEGAPPAETVLAE